MNRSNKKNDILRTQSQPTNPVQRKGHDILPRPDSGVVMDDGSDESGSVMLGHKDSVRTMRGVKPASSQVPETVREVGSSTLGFDLIRQPNMMTPMGMSSMDAADVQAWNHEVLYSQDTDLGLAGQFVQSDRTPQPEFLGWENMCQTGFGTMGVQDLIGNNDDRMWSFDRQ